jgi:hypothetical protein
MELVDGPTLAERIAEGPIPLEEALAIAPEIAEALEYAHEKGIVSQIEFAGDWRELERPCLAGVLSALASRSCRHIRAGKVESAQYDPLDGDTSGSVRNTHAHRFRRHGRGIQGPRHAP